MNYKQKYKEALDNAKVVYKTIRKDLKPVVEQIFPELKMSEDEKIRKQIISFLKEFEHDHYRSLDFSSWIAWLEKQGEQIDIANKEYWRGYREGMEVILDKYSELEKQGEQKPVDKVEPKFKVGDWVLWDNKISCFVNNIYRDGKSLMYAIIDTNNMIRTYSVKGFDNNAHLWTIEDAKEGDVLYYEDSDSLKIFIYQFGKVHYYCCLTNNVFVSHSYYFSVEKDRLSRIRPANTEQRNFLFARMKEEGYRWDKNKKEVIKL